MKLLLQVIIRNLLFLLLGAINAPILSLNLLNDYHNVAVIKDSIIDMSNSFPAPDNPSASPDIKSCRRAHQGLYNELVNCFEENENQIKIACNNIIYGFDTDTKKALNTFWIYKKYIAPLKELKDEILETIPNPNYAEEPTIVLIYPWKEFSIGTRFKYIEQYDTQTTYAIKRADYITNTVIYDFVPRENAIQEIKQDSKVARKLFVKIINNLIDRVAQSGQHYVIPYVWGGGSFIGPYLQDDFYKKDGTWHRDGKNNPYTGYDCSEFIVKMAKIAGIDFPWKTTTVIERSRRALDNKDQLEEGDLIWIQGHVMIISNIKCNEIIEARGYGSGYGCVHRIKLEEYFDGVTSYNDLLEHYYNNQTIKFKDKQGNVSEKANVFKFLKLID